MESPCGERLSGRKNLRRDLKALNEEMTQAKVISASQVLQRVALEAELNDHTDLMHPGYSFTGDNVDIRNKVRQMTITHQNRDHHMFHIVAYKNRVSGNDLHNEEPRSDVKKVPFTNFLPSLSENEILAEEFSYLVAKTWTTHIPSLQRYGENLPHHLSHVYENEMKQKTEKVHLGVLEKNEQYGDDMLDILDYINQYVPKHSDDTPEKILSGGDYLTFERHKEAQSQKQDSPTAYQRLEGLVAKIEDFHAQAEWQKVIWHHLYSTASSKDIGTLYAARNATNSRNVSSDPHRDFYANAELLDKFTNAYVITGGVHHFGMTNMNDRPLTNNYSGDDSADSKKEYILKEARKFVDKYVMNQVPKLEDTAPRGIMITVANTVGKCISPQKPREA
ncbi:uncharacterized protein [Ptychodera flava]|uniref:uncharacterized protein n=1 Tax=Ptychodera flava TaxID=63121 RepID=UPI00396A9E78